MILQLSSNLHTCILLQRILSFLLGGLNERWNWSSINRNASLYGATTIHLNIHVRFYWNPPVICSLFLYYQSKIWPSKFEYLYLKNSWLISCHFTFSFGSSSWCHLKDYPKGTSPLNFWGWPNLTTPFFFGLGIILYFFSQDMWEIRIYLIL